jgi:hypothetical protein
MKAMRKRYFGKRKEEKEFLDRLREIQKHENESSKEEEKSSNEQPLMINENVIPNVAMEEDHEKEVAASADEVVESDEDFIFGEAEELFDNDGNQVLYFESSNSEEELNFESEGGHESIESESLSITSDDDLEFSFESKDMKLTFNEEDDTKIDNGDDELSFESLQSESSSIIFEEESKTIELSEDDLVAKETSESESSESLESSEVVIEDESEHESVFESEELILYASEESKEELILYASEESKESEELLPYESEELKESEELLPYESEELKESEELLPYEGEESEEIIISVSEYEVESSQSSELHASEEVDPFAHFVADDENDSLESLESEIFESEIFETESVYFESSEKESEIELSLEELEFVTSVSEEYSDESFEVFSESEEHSQNDEHMITQKNRGGNNMSEYDYTSESHDCESKDVREVDFETCESVKKVEKHVKLKDQVRILKTKIKIEDVCPNSNVAVAAILLDDTGKTVGVRGGEFYVSGGDEYSDCTDCAELKVKFTFVIPEKDLCDVRKLKLKVISHYTELPK